MKKVRIRLSHDNSGNDEDSAPSLLLDSSTPSKINNRFTDSNNPFYGKTESHQYDHEESHLWRENMKRR
jgi:hypothetical protein